MSGSSTDMTDSFTQSGPQSSSMADSFLEVKHEVAVEAPGESLSKLLSIRSVISEHTVQKQHSEHTGGILSFRSIGRGFCAEIFHEPGTRSILKRAHDRSDIQLWHDYMFHTAVFHSIGSALDNIQFVHLSIPKPMRFIAANNEQWWATHRQQWPPGHPREASNILEMQLIPPLPHQTRQALIDQYCPFNLRTEAQKDPNNQNCLIRLYLGIRRPHGRPGLDEARSHFSLRNFEADLQVCSDLSIDTAVHAKTMAIALAVMHWSVKCNAQDVEFVLGSPIPLAEMALTRSEIESLPLFTSSDAALKQKRRAVQLWLLDFNQVEPISMDEDGVRNAVRAFWINDPYYPRPVPAGDADEELWTVFKKEYLGQSERCVDELARKRDLPTRFIEEVEKEAEKRRGNGLVSRGPPKGKGKSSAPIPKAAT
ncbi:MAG: hypothetical protein Q9174_001871 [Haloplaca sp. 1 TL-2023]